MVKISVSREGSVVRRYSLEKDRILVGRDPDCDVCIDNVAVSRQHASLYEADGTWILEDLKSGNGTFVDDRKIQTHRLRSGESFAIGKFAILFEIAEGEKGPDPDGMDRMSEQATFRIDKEELGKLVSKAIHGAPEIKATLTPEAGGETLLLNRPVHFAGSAPDCTVPGSGFLVSPRVAVFVRESAGFRLVRTGSGFGRVAVNGRAADNVVLQPGDLVQICGHRWKYGAK